MLRRLQLQSRYERLTLAAALGTASGGAVSAIALSSSSMSSSDFVGRTIATLTTTPPGATITLTDDASGQFSVSGNMLRLEKDASAGTYNITLRAGGRNFNKTITCSAYGYGSPIARWNARDLSLLKQDTAKTTAVSANNDPIGSWVDSVSGWELQQGTAANKPLYKSSIQNGLPGVSFDGSNDCMQAVTAALIGFHNTAQRPYTFIVVGNVRNYTNTSMLMGWGGSSGATRYFEWKIDNSGASFPGKQSLARGDGTHGIATTAYGVGASGTNTNGPAANTPSIYTMSSDGTVLFGALNGTGSYSPPISATLGNNGALTADTMFFGRQTNTAGNAPAIDVYEILVYGTPTRKAALRSRPWV